MSDDSRAPSGAPTRDIGPLCDCGHGLYEHYMCGGTRESQRCYRQSECGCVYFKPATQKRQPTAYAEAPHV